MINFDLSLPDDDEWLENLETEDDYKDREEYDRSMTPPSPSLLDVEDLVQEEDDIHNESEGTLKSQVSNKRAYSFIRFGVFALSARNKQKDLPTLLVYSILL